MTWRWATAAGSGLAAAMAAVLVTVSTAGGASLAGQGGQAAGEIELRACAQLSGASQKVTECLKDVFQRALAAGQLHALESELDSLTRGSATVADACHGAAHEAGMSLAQNPSEVVNGVIAANYTSELADGCLRGITHGITDATSVNPALMPDWEDLVEACEQVQVPEANETMSYGGCVEGIGHLAWNTTGDEGAAGKLCTAFTKPLDRELCAYSFLMEEFIPRPELVVRPVPPTRSAKQWASTCDELSTVGEDIRTGCLKGAGYVHVQTGNMKERGVELARLAVEDMERAVPVAKEMAREVVQWCSPLKDVVEGAVALCVDGGVTVWPNSIVYNPDFQEGLCGLTGTSSGSCASRKGSGSSPLEEGS